MQLIPLGTGSDFARTFGWLVLHDHIFYFLRLSKCLFNCYIVVKVDVMAGTCFSQEKWSSWCCWPHSQRLFIKLPCLLFFQHMQFWLKNWYLPLNVDLFCRIHFLIAHCVIDAFCRAKITDRYWCHWGRTWRASLLFECCRHSFVRLTWNFWCGLRQYMLYCEFTDCHT